MVGGGRRTSTGARTRSGSYTSVRERPCQDGGGAGAAPRERWCVYSATLVVVLSHSNTATVAVLSQWESCAPRMYGRVSA